MKYVTILYKFSVKESNLNSWCIIRVIRCNNNRRKQFFEVFIKYFFKYFLWNKKMHNLAKYIFMKNLLLIYFETRYLIHVKYATNLHGMRHILCILCVYLSLSTFFFLSSDILKYLIFHCESLIFRFFHLFTILFYMITIFDNQLKRWCYFKSKIYFLWKQQCIHKQLFLTLSI